MTQESVAVANRKFKDPSAYKANNENSYSLLTYPVSPSEFGKRNSRK